MWRCVRAFAKLLPAYTRTQPVIIPPAPEGEMTLEQKKERMATLMHLVSVIRARLAPALKSVGKRLGPDHMNEQLAQIKAELVTLVSCR